MFLDSVAAWGLQVSKRLYSKEICSKGMIQIQLLPGGSPIPLLQFCFLKKRGEGGMGARKETGGLSSSSFRSLSEVDETYRLVGLLTSAALSLATRADSLVLLLISPLLGSFSQQGGSVESILSQIVKISNDLEGILFISSPAFYSGSSLQGSRQKSSKRKIQELHIPGGRRWKEDV